MTIAPMRRAIRTKPLRVQLTRRRAGRGATPARAPGGDDEGSAGRVAGDDELVERELVGAGHGDVASVAVHAPPAAVSMRSVWSRLGAGSEAVVAPSAARPASRTHDFTCALATGSS